LAFSTFLIRSMNASAFSFLSKMAAKVVGLVMPSSTWR
jgi:hypothetical protein